MDALAEIVARFGAQHVFLVSKAGPSMQHRILRWLLEVMDVRRRTGLRRENIYFCHSISGPTGKGVLAAALGISHYVDDKDEALRAVYADSVANSAPAIEA